MEENYNTMMFFPGKGLIKRSEYDFKLHKKVFLDVSRISERFFLILSFV